LQAFKPKTYLFLLVLTCCVRMQGNYGSVVVWRFFGFVGA